MRLGLDQEPFLCANTHTEGVPDRPACRPEGGKCRSHAAEVQRLEGLAVPVFEVSRCAGRAPVDRMAPNSTAPHMNRIREQSRPAADELLQPLAAPSENLRRRRG